MSLLGTAQKFGYTDRKHEHMLGTTVFHPDGHEFVIYKNGRAQHSHIDHDTDVHACSYGRCGHVAQISTNTQLIKLLTSLHGKPVGESEMKSVDGIIDEVLGGGDAAQILRSESKSEVRLTEGKLSAGDKHAIQWLVGKIHVGTPDEEVAQEMRRRLENSAKKGKPATNALAKAVVNHALKCHKRNRDEYNQVMRGYK